jgi:hypothetical protein
VDVLRTTSAHLLMQLYYMLNHRQGKQGINQSNQLLRTAQPLTSTQRVLTCACTCITARIVKEVLWQVMETSVIVFALHHP